LLTGKALFAWQKDRRRFRLESVHPGASPEEVRECTGFDYDVAQDCPETVAPSAGDLELIRSVVKPEIAANYPDFAARVWPEKPAVRP
jgi:glutaconate CoA-transferase subunit B